jgi:hypothetical protein
MYPEDRVLVGVINRKRDLVAARDEHWYRIPRDRLSEHRLNAEYLAFFLSRGFGKQNGAVQYYAARRGLELVRRADLLPAEAGHKRAGEVYYKVGLGDLIARQPPIENPTRRPISFIFTTWDRFVHARVIRDLYSDNDYFVDRIYHALRDSGVPAVRYWDAEARQTGAPAHLRILCDGGSVMASPCPLPSAQSIDIPQGRSAAGTQCAIGGAVFMDSTQPDAANMAAIREAVARQGGPITIGKPQEGR